MLECVNGSWRIFLFNRTKGGKTKLNLGAFFLVYSDELVNIVLQPNVYEREVT